MGTLFRIKPKTVPYRRAGLAFESATEFVLLDHVATTPEQFARLCADDRLTIQFCFNGEAEPDAQVWELMPDQERELARDQLTVLEAGDWADLASDVLDPIDVQLIDTLTRAVEDCAPDLQRLGVTFVVVGETLPALISLLDATAIERDALDQALKDIQAEKAALGQELDLGNQSRTDALAEVDRLKAEIEPLKAKLSAAAKPDKKPATPKPA